MNELRSILQSLKETVLFRWKPGRELFAMLGSYVAVVALLASATFLATPENGVFYFLLYGVAAAGLAGVGFPVFWTVVVRKESVAGLGITKKGWKISLILQALFVLPQLAKVIESIGDTERATLMPLIALALSIGLFEAIFWRGWVLQVLERAFGLVPAVIAGAALYAAYHVGYGMTFGEMIFLFFIGLAFAVAFAITRNILVLWPIFQPSGQLITIIEDGLALPGIATLGFSEALALMLFIIVFAERRRIAAGKRAALGTPA